MRSISAAEPEAEDLFDPRGVALIAVEKFQRSPYSGIKSISCHFREGVLTLCGTAPTHHMKQLAKSMASMVDAMMMCQQAFHKLPLTPPHTRLYVLSHRLRVRRARPDCHSLEHLLTLL